MFTPFRRTSLVAAITSSLAVSVFADTTLPVTMVTATRQPMRVNELLADASIISREDIEQAGQSTLNELLGRQPGLQAVANGGPGSSSSIFIRGANSNQTLILVDGQRINSATTGATALENIPLAEIDHIEILRGPGAALYGSDAIGGVIQIFTRRGEGAPRLDAFAGFGRYGTNQADVGYSGASGALSYSLRAGVYNTDGFSATTDPKKLSSYNPDKDGFDQRHLGANLALKLNDTDEAGFNLLHTDGTNQYDNDLTNFNDRIDKKLDSYQIWLRNRLASSWNSTLRLGRSTDDSTTINRTSQSVFRTDQDQFQWQNDITLPVGTALLAYEYVDQQVSGTTSYATRKRQINSILAGWSGSVDQHRFQINVRNDDNSQYGSKTTSLASYGYQFTPLWRSYLSVGTSFRAPSFNELYYPGFGNANLKPESANNREIGLIRDDGIWNTSLTIYDNRVSNLINTVCDASWNCLPENVAKARLQGATLSFGTQVYGFNLGGSIDILNARDESSGKRLSRRANEQGNLHLSHNWGAWVIGGELTAVGARYDDADNTNVMGGYTLLNAFARYRLTTDWNLEIRGNNLGDRRYETVRGYGVPGANLFVGLRYGLK